jgi:LysM repeat protein
MKTPRTLQTKRTSPKKGFRIMHAATRSPKKRRQRASTTAAPADLGEVSGVGVPLALVVILLLHVAAIAGIWIHDKWTESADLEATKVALKGDAPPQRITSLDFHLVSSGDTVASIAREYGVSQDSLMSANEGIGEYEAGWKINIPAARKTNVSPSVAIAGGNNVEDEPLKFTPQSRPLIQTSNDESIRGSRPGDLVEVGGVEAGKIEQAVLIRPVSPVRIDQARSSTVANGANQHIVKSGDTLWGIARNNKVTVDQLKRANPNVNTNALKIGAKLVIPTKR